MYTYVIYIYIIYTYVYTLNSLALTELEVTEKESKYLLRENVLKYNIYIYIVSHSNPRECDARALNPTLKDGKTWTLFVLKTCMPNSASDISIYYVTP